MLLLLLLFIVVPAVELSLLIQVGGAIGVLPTLLLIIGTGVLGAALARSQGLSVLHQLRSELAAGTPPDRTLLEGALILVAGAVLITPGFLTDALGVLCLVPWTRRSMLALLSRVVKRSATRGLHVTFTRHGAGPWTGPGPAPFGAGPRSLDEPTIKDVPFEERRDP